MGFNCVTENVNSGYKEPFHSIVHRLESPAALRWSAVPYVNVHQAFHSSQLLQDSLLLALVAANEKSMRSAFVSIYVH
jgi:hypothetical protein